MKSNFVFRGYLKELKLRLVYTGIAFLLNFGILFYFSTEIFILISKPLGKASNQMPTFIYTHLSESFLSQLKLSIIGGFLLTIPIILIQVWIFYRNGLYVYEEKFLRKTCMISLILFLLGMYFSYYIVLPIAWKFFLGFQASQIDLIEIEFQPKIGEYLDFFGSFLFSITICSQIPLILGILLHLKIMNLEWFIQKRRYTIIFSLFLGALLSPPDIYSQFLLGSIILLSFEIVIFLRILNNCVKNNNKKTKNT